MKIKRIEMLIGAFPPGFRVGDIGKACIHLVDDLKRGKGSDAKISGRMLNSPNFIILCEACFAVTCKVKDVPYNPEPVVAVERLSE